MKKNPKYENSIWQHFDLWAKGEYDPLKGKLESRAPTRDRDRINIARYVEKMKAENEELFELGQKKQLSRFQRAYYVIAIALGLFMTVLLLILQVFFPPRPELRRALFFSACGESSGSWYMK